jgi:lipopolysaccharide/colanic/teichoic acid biosynthesis glycosyltransferase
MQKRLFDIIFSLFILVLFFPFGLMIAVLIALDSRGGVFFSQERVGKKGKHFKLLKFRSMHIDSERKGTLTVGMKDPRITRAGYWLRKTKLDEFPQFLNVIFGDMSIVGPRPETPDFVALYSVEQQKVLTVRPGITDYASLKYFKENEILALSSDPRKTYIQEIMPEKLRLNLQYVNEHNFFKDLEIICLTVLKIFKA